MWFTGLNLRLKYEEEEPLELVFDDYTVGVAVAVRNNGTRIIL